MQTKRKLIIGGIAVIAVMGFMLVPILARSEKSTPQPSPPREEPSPGWDRMLQEARAVNERAQRPSPQVTPDDQLARQRVFSIPMIIPQEFVSKQPGWRPDVIPPPVYSGALSTNDIFDRYWGFLEWGNEHIHAESQPALDKCRVEWQQRGHNLADDYNGVLGLHIVGDGTRLEVADVDTAHANWPSNFDEEVKECIIGAYAGRGEASALIADFIADYPICFSN